MNKKGFSLVELLAVIAVIGLLLVITIPNMVELVGNFKNKDRIEMLKNSAISAAKEYVVDGNSVVGISICTSGTQEGEILIQDLINNKYLDAVYTEYYDDENNIKIGNKVKVTYSCDAKKFTDYEVVIDES